METNLPFFFADVGLTVLAVFLMLIQLVAWTEFAKTPVPLTKHGEFVADLVLLGGIVLWDILVWMLAFVPSSQKPIWYDLAFIGSFPVVGCLMILTSVARNYQVHRKYLSLMNGLRDESEPIEMSFRVMIVGSFSGEVVEAAIFVSLIPPLVYTYFVLAI